jgi:sugar lactone lactonase YvrE
VGRAFAVIVGAALAVVVASAAAPPQAAPIREPYAVVVEPSGTLLVADGGSGRVVRVDPRSGRRRVFVRRLGRVYDVAYARGAVYASTSTRVWRFARGRRQVIARGLRDAVGLDVAADGSIYVAESAANRVLRIDGRTRRRSVVASAGLDQPIGLVRLKDGSLLVSDSHHGRVVRVEAGGRLEPVLEGLSLPVGLTPAAGGGVLVVDHVRHDAFGKILLLRRDGTVETLSAGKIRAPTGIAVGRGGVRYVTAFARPFLGRLDASGALRPLVGRGARVSR